MYVLKEEERKIEIWSSFKRAWDDVERVLSLPLRRMFYKEEKAGNGVVPLLRLHLPYDHIYLLM